MVWISEVVAEDNCILDFGNSSLHFRRPGNWVVHLVQFSLRTEAFREEALMNLGDPFIDYRTNTSSLVE